MLRVAIPLTVVFDGKQIRQEMSYGEILWTTYDGTSNGWVNSEIFDSLFSSIFKLMPDQLDHCFYCWMGIHLILTQGFCVWVQKVM